MTFSLLAVPHRFPLVVASCLAACASLLQAQAPFPSPVISSIYPMGGEPGSTVEITFKGTDLDGPASALLSSSATPPVVAKPKLDSKGRPEAGKVLLTLPAEMTPGTYDVRFVGRFGVSNPRVFQVQPVKVVESPGTNVKADKALKVPLNTAIHGVFRAGVPHWFAFEAKKGQRVLAVFTGAEFDSRASLVGSLSGASGRELARMRDGLLDFRPTEDGTCWLKVHDLMYGSGEDFGYRLTLTTGPVVWAASPDTLYGWNLPGSQLLSEVRVGPGAPLERLKADAATVARLSAASPRKLLTLPAENEPPHEPRSGDVTPLQVGQSWADWFPARGGVRTFDLAFKAGDRFTLEVISQQAGFATDPALLVEAVKKDAAGKETLAVQADLNDPPATVPAPTLKPNLLDPVLGYDAKADGVFRLSLNDPLNAASGHRNPYLLRVLRRGEARQDLAIAMLPTLPKTTAAGPYEMGHANVCRQGISAVEVFLPGRSAQSGAVELKLDHLPPGVTCLGGFMGPGQSLGYLGLKASGDAPPGAALAQGLGRTLFLNRPVKDTGREALVMRISATAPAVGVVAQEAPALLESVHSGVQEVLPDGKLEIPFKLTRNSAFTGALKMKVLGLIDPTKAPELDIPAKGTEGKLTLDMKVLKLPPGDYGFILQGSAKMSVRRDPEAFAAAEAQSQAATGNLEAARKQLSAAQPEEKAAPPGDKAVIEVKQASVKDSGARLALAEKARAETDKAVKELAAKDPLKEAVFTIYSNPVRMRVKEAAAK